MTHCSYCLNEFEDDNDWNHDYCRECYAENVRAEKKFNAQLDNATHLVFKAFGLKLEQHVDSADLLNEAISNVMKKLFVLDLD